MNFLLSFYILIISWHYLPFFSFLRPFKIQNTQGAIQDIYLTGWENPNVGPKLREKNVHPRNVLGVHNDRTNRSREAPSEHKEELLNFEDYQRGCGGLLWRVQTCLDIVILGPPALGDSALAVIALDDFQRFSFNPHHVGILWLVQKAITQFKYILKAL